VLKGRCGCNTVAFEVADEFVVAYNCHCSNAGTTITGDAWCRATNVDYRLDTPSARAFLRQYVRLP
jgi:hypothetical protein